VQLRHAGFVHADLLANLLHRRLLVVVEADDFLLTRRKGRDGGADTIRRLRPFVRRIRPLRLRRDQRFRYGRLVEVVVIGQRRGGFDRVDAHDRPTEALLVGTQLIGQVGERRLVTEFPPQLLTGCFELPPLPPHPPRPCVLAQGIDHRTANPALGKRLELDATGFVEPVGRIDQPDDSVLDEVTDVDRMGHCRGDATGELLDERYTRNHTRVLIAVQLGAAHLDPPAPPIATGIPNGRG